MLVFGDVEQPGDAAELHRDVLLAIRALDPHLPSSERHAAAVGALLQAADLLRAMLDAEAMATGADELTPTARTSERVLIPLARLVDASWRTGDLNEADRAMAECAVASLAPNGVLRTKPTEGYAFYAVYPEAYAEAARRSGLPSTTRVIGIRSIGVSIAAMVAVGLGGERFVTVRPVGHPFDRQLSISPMLAEHILAGNPPCFAVVDEGPGLSGSSFAAVADWLAAQGVERSRIHFFPGHSGDPGSEAGERRLNLWHATPRHHVSTDEMLLEGRLETRLSELIGPLEAPLLDISWGKWRGHVRGARDAPVAPPWERRKFIARTPGGKWLLKFAGLGETGVQKLALARALHVAGFGPQPVGLCHGFLVQRWIEAPNLLDCAVERSDMVEALGGYLSFRASLAAPADSGATLDRLAHMAVYNVREALGDEAAASIAILMRPTPELAGAIRRVETDNRLHRWEWLVDRGRLIKTDALDHARTHDFIGRQDIAWDVAGAIFEHDLGGDGTERLLAILSARGHKVHAGLLGFMIPAYLAFQLGGWTMWTGADSTLARRYAGLLRGIVEQQDQKVTNALTNPSGLSRVAFKASPS